MELHVHISIKATVLKSYYLLSKIARKYKLYLKVYILLFLVSYSFNIYQHYYLFYIIILNTLVIIVRNYLSSRNVTCK